MADPQHDDQIARYADILAALGTETRLRIVRLLLSAHPDGLVSSYAIEVYWDSVCAVAREGTS